MYIVRLGLDMWLCKSYPSWWQSTYVRENAEKFPTAVAAEMAAYEFCQGWKQYEIEQVSCV